MQVSTGSRSTVVIVQLLVVALLASLFAVISAPSPAGATPGEPVLQVQPSGGEPFDADPERIEQPRNITTVESARLLDTRSGRSRKTIDGRFEGTGVLAKKGTLELVVAGRGGVPDDAAGVVLNVTVLKPTGRGSVTVFACDERRPRASNLNYRRKDTVSNAVLAKVGSAGRVCIYSTRATNLVVDVNGYVADEADTKPLTPARLLDTRSGRSRKTIDGRFEGTGVLAKKGTLELVVAGRGGVPDDAAGVVLNVTVLKPTGRGSVTVFACDERRPRVSNLNYRRKDTVSNAVLAKVGSAGRVCIYSTRATNLVVDVNGYVADGTGTNPVTPARLADTRSGRKRRTVDGQYEGLGKLGRGAITEIRIAGRGGVPDTGVGAVLLNVTALKPTGRGSVTVFPCGQQRPLAANLNHRRKRGTTNAVLARLGDGGKVCFHTSVGTHLVVDVHGWFDLPPNQPESDVVVLDDEPFEFESISGGDSDPIGSFDEEVDNPEIVRITTEEPTLVEGDTVVLSKPSGEPYYGEVTSVAGTSVIAEEVSLAEVLPTMDVSLESDMDGNVSEIVGGEAVSNFVIDRGLTTANEDSTTDFKCTAEATVDFTASAQVDVARFVFDVSFNIFDGLTAARIGFNPTLRAEVTATASAKASCEVYKELYKKELPTIKFLVGPVPVWITQEVTVGIGAEVSAEAAGSISLVGEASAFAGIVFEDGQWDRRTTITTNFSQQVSEDVVISATISAPVITYGARAYGIAGFDVAIAANLQLTYRPLAKKVLTLTTFVDLRISLVVKLDLVVTGLHWQFDFPRIMVWGPLELWSYSQAATNCDRSTIPEAQCEALVELWDQAGGRDWADAATWVSDDDPCGWEGVTCSGSNVTALDLSNKGVNGPVPTVFGGLTTLETLDLSSDTGFAPNTIDSIPASIADLDALRILDLANTGLTAVPPEIGGLARLRKLELSDNALTSLPETIGTLRRLRSLILDGNPLVSLPREIGDLSNLRTLRVERAPLTNLPTELSELTALVDLFVSDTPIQQVPYLGNATNLFAVFLGGTDITELPGGFENLTSLFVLNAENTGIRALPIGLGASPDLFQLQLRNTAIDSDITETMRRIQQTAPEVAIWLTSSGCPIVTDPAVRAWLDGQVVTNHEGPGSSHVPWDSNCSA